MSYTVKKVQIWAGDILNRPGMMARVLEALTNAGAELEFIVARRVSEKTSRVFLAPVKGRRQKRAAQDVGLVEAEGMHAMRIEGPDRVGLGGQIARTVAESGINLRGASAAALGRKAVFYLAFATESELSAALKAVRRLLPKNTRK